MTAAAIADELWEKGSDALAPEVRDHVLSGASDGCGMERNRRALEDLAFVPKALDGHREPDLRTTVLGAEVSAPLATAPIGSVHFADPDAGRAILEVLHKQQILGFVGLFAMNKLAEMEPLPPQTAMLQIYPRGDDHWLEDIIHQAEERGFHGFCITVDSRVAAYRPNDRRNRFVRRDILGPAPNASPDPNALAIQMSADWERMERIRRMTDRPLVLKGVLDVDEARRAVSLGYDAVYVSNHGGRNLAHAVSAAEALAEIADALGDDVPLIVDGGFRDAEDVVKGLALGADLVAFGRPHYLALAAEGRQGLSTFFDAVKEQLAITMRLMGLHSLSDIDRRILRIGGPWAQYR